MSAQDSGIGRWLQRQWYAKPHQMSLCMWPLAPLGMVYGLMMRVRRAMYLRDWFARERLAVPVVVVGNVAVGGTGKTPLTVAIVECLSKHGLKPGVLCRGYGGRSRSWPRLVDADAAPDEVGDEAVLLRQRCACPVVAGPGRAAAGRLLIERHGCDVIVCDDGLQHLALERDVEIAVVDAARGQGNNRCLPAGPLREPAGRLATVDLLVEHVGSAEKTGDGGSSQRGRHAMWLRPGPLRRLGSRASSQSPAASRVLADFSGQRVRALAGIGNPERFFAMLERYGLDVERHPLGDHHDYQVRELDFDASLPVLVTEKDAVKLAPLLQSAGADGTAQWWCVPVSAQLDDSFTVALLALLAMRSGQRGVAGQDSNQASGRRRHQLYSRSVSPTRRHETLVRRTGDAGIAQALRVGLCSLALRYRPAAPAALWVRCPTGL